MMATPKVGETKGSCPVFEAYQISPSLSDPTLIWAHLKSCTLCLEKFELAENPARELLAEFEFAGELKLLQEVFPEWKKDTQKSGLSTKITPCSSDTSNSIPNIPGYSTERRLGQGGSSQVWLARQEGLGRLVALKIMNKTTEDQKERLQKECRILASLSHPYLLPIYSNGIYDNKVWMALEYCPGGSLNFQLMNVWEPKKAAELVRKVALAAQAVHEKGIIHRDIKPGNILLGTDGEPKLADFDLARAMEIGQESTRQTQILGTPAYIAPEQVRSKKVDARADIHALGGVLYHLLTGKAPFKADTPYEALLMAVHTVPVSPQVLRPGLPRDIDQICRKCMAKDPGDRYRSAIDLADDLERFDKNIPVKARPLNGAQNAWRWAKRNPAISLSAFVASLALLLVAMISLFAALQAISFASRTKWLNGELENAIEDAKKEASRAQENEKQALSELYYNRIARAHSHWENSETAAAQDQLDQCPVGLRGWEHDYLHTLFHSDHIDLDVGKDPIFAIAFSNDGKMIASGGDGDEILIFDFKTAKKIRSFNIKSGHITCLSFIGGDKKLVSGSNDGTIKIWDIETGTIDQCYEYKNSGISSFEITKNQQKLISSTNKGEILIYDLKNHKKLSLLKVSDDLLQSVTISPSGKEFACAGMDQIVRIFDIENHSKLREFKANHYIYCLCYSPDGKRIATANVDEKESVTIWDSHTGRNLLNLRGHTDDVRCVQFSPDGETLYSVASDRKILIWDSHTGEIIQSLKGHSNSVYSIKIHKNCLNLLSCGHNGELKIWNLNNTILPYFKNRENGNRNKTLCLRKQTDQLVVGNDHGEIRFFNKNSLALLNVIKVHDEMICSMDISTDGNQGVIGYWDGTILLLDLETGKRVQKYSGHTSVISKIRFSPNGDQILSCSWDGTVRFWERDSGREIGIYRSPVKGDKFTSLSWNSPKNIIIVSDLEGNLLFFDPKTFKILKSLKFDSGITAFTNSKDNSRIIVFCKDHSAFLVECQQDEFIQTILEKQNGEITSAVFAPDESIFATCDNQWNVKVWNTAKKKMVLTIKQHTDTINDVVFSDDGKTLYSCGLDRSIRANRAQLQDPYINISNIISYNQFTKPEFQSGKKIDFFGFLGGTDQIFVKNQQDYRLYDFINGTERTIRQINLNDKNNMKKSQSDDGKISFFAKNQEVYVVDNFKLNNQNQILTSNILKNSIFDHFNFLCQDAKTRSKIKILLHSILYSLNNK